MEASQARIEVHNDGDVIYVCMDVMAVQTRVAFPHPLIALDYDEHGNEMGFSASGRMALPAVEAWLAWKRREVDAPLFDYLVDPCSRAVA